MTVRALFSMGVNVLGGIYKVIKYSCVILQIGTHNLSHS